MVGKQDKSLVGHISTAMTQEEQQSLRSGRRCVNANTGKLIQLPQQLNTSNPQRSTSAGMIPEPGKPQASDERCFLQQEPAIKGIDQKNGSQNRKDHLLP